MKQSLMAIICVLVLTSCHKNNAVPANQAQAIGPNTSLNHQSTLDTSRTGRYLMSWSSDASEMSPVILRLYYRSMQVNGTDTSILYSIANNTSVQVPGNVQLSKSVTYINGGSNKSQPYLKDNKGTIENGFTDCPSVYILSGNFTSDGSILITFYVAGKSNLSCKYQKL